jgi:hypothetical protein
MTWYCEFPQKRGEGIIPIREILEGFYIVDHILKSHTARDEE